MKCAKLKSFLPDLVFDPARVPSTVRDHLHACPACRKNLETVQAELQSTMRLLDDWKTSEPSPYFDVRLAARLHEAKQTEPAGFLERLRIRLTYSGNLQLRPALAATLALVITVGGGSYLGFVGMNSTSGQHRATSATIHDLQILDANDQTIQQLNAFDDNDSAASTSATSGTAATSAPSTNGAMPSR